MNSYKIVDTHPHLCDPIFDSDRTEVIETVFENTCRLYGKLRARSKISW
ncbi:MAG: hypothetical protein LWX02_02485 [Deltaproteobacteria bacterium]|nr:hypothetical protein [Deltaproteobacteria bacterium]MDL1986409.1 hypothetical protein [Deltaproteobacteria bacterium]